MRGAENPDGDIAIEVLGPGEKLYEKLLIGNNPETKGHARIMKARDGHLDWKELNAAMVQFRLTIGVGHAEKIRQTLVEIVSEFVSAEDVAAPGHSGSAVVISSSRG